MNIIAGIPLLQQPGGNMTVSLITFGAVIAIFYFLIIRPQRKKQKDAKEMIANVKKGNRVTTIGGIKGTIQSVKDDTVVVKVDSDTKLVFLKSAISSVDDTKTGGAAKKEKAEPKAIDNSDDADDEAGDDNND